MCNPISNHFNREPLSVADGLIASESVAHDARQFQGLSDPATIFLMIQFDRDFHATMIPLTMPMCSRLALLDSGNEFGIELVFALPGESACARCDLVAAGD